MAAPRGFQVFTMPTCRYCQLVKEWLTTHGCPFEERVITKDVEALREWRRISGGEGVPVVAFGRDIVIGFDEDRLHRFVNSCRQSTPVDLPVAEE